ncbi:hypothetical protein ACFONI_12610 [Aeromonas media]|uniref:hypothetical protein n=1 Tax=Aeromonas media TaxID=651 RepID=UPI0036231F07
MSKQGRPHRQAFSARGLREDQGQRYRVSPLPLLAPSVTCPVAWRLSISAKGI